MANSPRSLKPRKSTKSQSPKAAPTSSPADCRRTFDCRCHRPLAEMDGAPCPREHRDCICRWTWRDPGGWVKGDANRQCLVHGPAARQADEAQEEQERKAG